MSSGTQRTAGTVPVWLLALALFAPTFGCSDGDDGDDGDVGPPGPPTEEDRDLELGEAPPGVVLTVIDVTGASGAGGRFAVGDRLSVRFTLEQDDGSRWGLSEMNSTRALVSGPTFNYQRILAQVSDVRDEAVLESDGSWTYRFADPIPATYLPPLNDTPSFGADDGELSGQPLLDGAYTVGMYFRWDYTVASEPYRDVGDTTFDFLVGPTAAMAPREVVKRQNCNQCHADLQSHGGQRRATTLCLLCHTAGSEDRNVASVAGGTPGVTVEFKVMIHRIHNGSHLPSVLGVTTDGTGTRDYTATPEPYLLVGFGNSVHDYSDVVFPAWPNLTNPMPRDGGYSALSATDQALEDELRSGVTSCNLCHGDPDGPGPLTAPEQGGLAFSQPTRRACASCHDDWVTTNPYTANSQTMPPQLVDGACIQCHGIVGSSLAVETAHLHPLRDPTFATGYNIDVQAVAEAGSFDGDGTIDPGERMAVTFTIQDDQGADIDPADLSSIDTGLSGPTWNANAFQFQSIPTDILTGPQPFTVNLPARVYFEYLGDATAGMDVFATNLAPQLAVPSAPTDVFERTGSGAGSSQLAADVTAPINFVDVDDPTGFDRNDIIVIEDGGLRREYLQIQFVDDDRLWFSSPATTSYSPGPQLDHPMGASVQELELVLLTEGVEYDLEPVTGTITETGGFGDGDALVTSYTSDFELQDVYPLTLNDGPDLTEVDGGWRGKSMVSGTYTLSMWGRRDLTLDAYGESNAYRELARGVGLDFLVGDATTIEPYDLIASQANCYACHVDIAFHGNNRRGFVACLACHGDAAAGDRTRYVAAGAPETEGVTIDFREMLHRIHMGEELTNASSHVVVGFGLGYPNNFSEHTYGEVVFPAMPSGTQACTTCHGANNTAWLAPGDRDHPTEQGQPVHAWRIVCGACHDSAAANAHYDIQTTASGVEACSVCHGPGAEFSVEAEHLVR